VPGQPGILTEEKTAVVAFLSHLFGQDTSSRQPGSQQAAFIALAFYEVVRSRVFKRE
jgi:hypothetical protein